MRFLRRYLNKKFRNTEAAWFWRDPSPELCYAFIFSRLSYSQTSFINNSYHQRIDAAQSGIKLAKSYSAIWQAPP